MEEYTTEGSVTTPTVNTQDWLKMLEGVEEYLRTFCGVNDTQLLYVERKQLVNTAEAGEPLYGYDAIDKEMVARAPIVVAGTVGNNAALEANTFYFITLD